MLYTILTFFVVLTAVNCANDGYYWREFTGTVPSDAIIAGRDIDGTYVYIGQGYVRGGGVMTVQIKDGTRRVLAEFGGVKVLQKHVKILCGRQKNFRWVPVTSKNFYSEVNKSGGKLVIGGHEVNHGSTSIGRINYEQETKVAKVNSFIRNDVVMHVPVQDDKAIPVKSYEVLVFDNN